MSVFMGKSRKEKPKRSTFSNFPKYKSAAYCNTDVTAGAGSWAELLPKLFTFGTNKAEKVGP